MVMPSEHHYSSRLGCTILGSGSKGNASVIHAPCGDFLLDAGFSMKELCARMVLRGIEPENIRAILVTHEHSDHIQGCRVFADHFGIPAYLTPDTCRIMSAKKQTPEKLVLISPGFMFELCGLAVEPFSIPHDVADAVAFTFRAGEARIGYATDLGCLNMLIIHKLSGCDAIVLESNYDPETLRNSSRPLSLKRRIMSRHGHLSNDEAISAIKDLLRPNTRHLIFAHLSEECNNQELVERKTRHFLEELSRSDIDFRVAAQGGPLETFWI